MLQSNAKLRVLFYLRVNFGRFATETWLEYRIIIAQYSGLLGLAQSIYSWGGPHTVPAGSVWYVMTMLCRSKH